MKSGFEKPMGESYSIHAPAKIFIEIGTKRFPFNSPQIKDALVVALEIYRISHRFSINVLEDQTVEMSIESRDSIKLTVVGTVETFFTCFLNNISSGAFEVDEK